MWRNSICRVKEIIEKIVRKSNREEHLRNEDQEWRAYSESIRVKEKESRRNQVIYTVNIDRTKSRLLINDPQTQKFILEVIPIIQLGAIENKTAINISDQKLQKVFGSRAKSSRARKDKVKLKDRK